jgi:hypothetical protein
MHFQEHAVMGDAKLIYDTAGRSLKCREFHPAFRFIHVPTATQIGSHLSSGWD